MLFLHAWPVLGRLTSMPRRGDPNLATGHLCRFRGALIPWGEILRLLRVDPAAFMQRESARLGALRRPEPFEGDGRLILARANNPDEELRIPAASSSLRRLRGP
jgi:hypothetical protein